MQLRETKGWMGGVEWGCERGHWVRASEGYRRELEGLGQEEDGERGERQDENEGRKGEGEDGNAKGGEKGGGKGKLVKTDALLTTCMMLNLLSWADVPAVKDEEHRKQMWPFVKRVPGGRSPLHWLRVQMGMGALLMGLHRCENRREGSMWLDLFGKMDHEPIYDDRLGTEGLSVEWCEMFEIDDRSEVTGHPYLRMVRRVVHLRGLWEDTERRILAGEDVTHDDKAIRYAQYMQAVDAEVVERLEERDPRMLLLFAHCLALSCQVSEWWCRRRVVQECYNIVQYLQEFHSNEMDWSWLEFPARNSGYRLDEMEGIETNLA